MTLDKRLPVFVIEGPNWLCEVEINESNQEYPHEEQAIEAATQAVEAFKGSKPNDTFEVKDPNGEPPYMSIVLYTYLKGSDPAKTCVYIPAHLALGNAGFYKDSFIIFTHFIKHIESQKKAEMDRQNKLEQEIQNFEQLKEDLKKPVRKPRGKRKGDEGKK